jgi:DNA replication and repair protein RecF
VYVQRLRLTNFRTYARLVMEPAPGVNLLVGANAQGKTNVLEALTVLSMSKSPRTSRDAEMVRFGEETMQIAADVHRENTNDITLEVFVGPPDAPSPAGPPQKTVRINGQKRGRATELLGQMQAVGFWPDDVEVVRGEPSGRRRFVNAALCQISPQYCYHLAQYRRVLEQRNRLLKIIRARGSGRGDSLDAWDEQLVQYGTRLVTRRARFAVELETAASAIHDVLSAGEEKLTVRYVPSVAAEGDEASVAQAFRESLAACRMDEFARGITLAGPHRDDFAFGINGVDARTFGSLGQQRTVALSLRIAELRLMEEETGEPCIVLMDEVLAELDEWRLARVVEMAFNGRQCFVTATGVRRFPFPALEDWTVWDVGAGTVTRRDA